MHAFAVAGAAVGSLWVLYRCRQSRGRKRVHSSGMWVAEGVLPEEERAVLLDELLVGLERRGERDLRWYGMNWLDGRTEMTYTTPIPPRSQQIANRLAKRCGFPCGEVNVMTIHRYHRSPAKKGTGALGRREVAITPHIDDARLAGEADGVLMVQLTGTCEVVLL
eukprot:Sspe_Gene.70505::Locus_41636_Transcript_2_3_Confidence_0.545_Length_551::g.70505::m.70505